jgi:hypothetical protein
MGILYRSWPRRLPALAQRRCRRSLAPLATIRQTQMTKIRNAKLEKLTALVYRRFREGNAASQFPFDKETSRVQSGVQLPYGSAARKCSSTHARLTQRSNKENIVATSNPSISTHSAQRPQLSSKLQSLLNGIQPSVTMRSLLRPSSHVRELGQPLSLRELRGLKSQGKNIFRLCRTYAVPAADRGELRSLRISVWLLRATLALACIEALLNTWDNVGESLAAEYAISILTNMWFRAETLTLILSPELAYAFE